VTPGEFELLPGAASAVRRINESGILVILITNQRWLSDPAASIDAYLALERELDRQLAAEGAALDGRYVCPHPKDCCDCRKPAPGMLLQAAVDFDIGLTASFVIGDALTDVEVGRAVGATTVLIDPREGGVNADSSVAHFTAGDVGAAVDWAIRRSSQRPPHNVMTKLPTVLA